MQTRNGYTHMFTGFVAAFSFFNCQRWDYNTIIFRLLLIYAKISIIFYSILPVLQKKQTSSFSSCSIEFYCHFIIPSAFCNILHNTGAKLDMLHTIANLIVQTFSFETANCWAPFMTENGCALKFFWHENRDWTQ